MMLLEFTYTSTPSWGKKHPKMAAGNTIKGFQCTDFSTFNKKFT